MSWRSRLRRLLRRVGYDVAPFRPVDCPNARRGILLDAYQIDVVLDVGANVGQYGRRLRDAGYRGQILSFEPLPDAFEALCHKTRTDPLWSCAHVAVGDTDGEAKLHISRDSVSSSLLPYHDRLALAEPAAAYVGAATVPLRRLDTLVSGRLPPDRRLWLKLDVQGYERPVLDGAGSVLERTRVVEAELSLVPLYEGQALYREIIDRLETLGFDLITIDRAFTHPRTGHVLQVDGVFARADGTRPRAP
ncbi:MAG: FkbM family methyltransferase [Thermomicrobiales bacterium]|nr:FkbM family methyltransferase [Thermomicrobiales bacterium]